jgi:AAA family ATP:ADP antiporter
MSTESKPEFGRVRSLFWPVYRNELKVFIPMLLIFFLINFNYTILRIAKDTLVVTAKASGAAAIPFLKTWAILPMALLMTYLFTRLSNRFHTERVFYLMTGLFLGFFLLFGFVIYPLHDSLHPHALADRLEAFLPEGCRGFISIFRNWTFTAFYVMAELWGTAIMAVLFWGFANEITSVHAARRFYGILCLAGNLSGVVSGEASTWISLLGKSGVCGSAGDPWGSSLMITSLVTVAAGIIIVALFRYMHTTVLTSSSDGTFHFKADASTIKMSIRENFAYLARSKYLVCIAVIMLTYHIAINLTEVVWKDQLNMLCPDPNDYQAYSGNVVMAIGVVSTLIGLFCSSIIRTFNWTVSAMITPVIVLVTGVGFFSFLLLKGFGAHALAFGATPLALGVFFGSMQNCLCRASKYTLFDATKELAFIPLSRECKLKGKAAIDGVGSRLGKSGSAVIYQFLLMFLGSLSATIPYVALIMLVVVAAWMIAVRSLGKQFNALTAQGAALRIPEPAPQAEAEMLRQT